MASINKALIAAAGFGSRFFPITKTIQKEMLPILNLPAIYYNVLDCVNAGITNIVIEINENNSQVEHFFSDEKYLREFLEMMGKSDKYDEIKDLPKLANFEFIKHDPFSQGYGTGTVVKIARQHFKNEEAFVVLMGDDFIFNEDDFSETKAMIETFNSSGATAALTCVTRDQSELHKYGVLEIEERNGFKYMKNIVEKPAPGTAPSNLINISKYIFTSEVFELLESQQNDKGSNELYITDTILTLAKNKDVVLYTPRGEYLDCGNPITWLKANLRVAFADPATKDEIKSYIKTID